MENIVWGTVMKGCGLDKMDDTFADFTQKGGVGEVGCPKWVKSRGEVTPEWIEDDDDFRVVLRRPVDWNEGASGSDSVISRTTQETAQQTTRETLKKSRDRNGDKSRDRRDDNLVQKTTAARLLVHVTAAPKEYKQGLIADVVICQKRVA